MLIFRQPRYGVQSLSSDMVEKKCGSPAAPLHCNFARQGVETARHFKSPIKVNMTSWILSQITDSRRSRADNARTQNTSVTTHIHKALELFCCVSKPEYLHDSLVFYSAPFTGYKITDTLDAYALIKFCSFLHKSLLSKFHHTYPRIKHRKHHKVDWYLG